MMKDECSNKKCYYILDYYFFNTRLFDQRNIIFRDYVVNNMNYIENLPSGDKLYTNTK